MFNIGKERLVFRRVFFRLQLLAGQHAGSKLFRGNHSTSSGRDCLWVEIFWGEILSKLIAFRGKKKENCPLSVSNWKLIWSELEERQKKSEAKAKWRRTSRSWKIKRNSSEAIGRWKKILMQLIDWWWTLNWRYLFWWWVKRVWFKCPTGFAKRELFRGVLRRGLYN